MRLLLLALAAVAPLAAAGPLPETPPVTESHCTGGSDPTACTGAVLKAAACRTHLLGAPPKFITFPDPKRFSDCLEAAHL